MVGHIHPGLHKEMTVTFKTDQPINMNEEVVLCTVTKITFEKETSQVGFTRAPHRMLEVSGGIRTHASEETGA